MDALTRMVFFVYKMVAECSGCANQVGQDKCSRYADASVQHNRIGGCPMRTHNRVKVTQEKDFIDPLKLSKRRQKGVVA